MGDFLVRFAKNDNGAAAVEYGLLVAAISAIIILTVFYLGGYVFGAFSTTCSAFLNSSSVSHVATGGAAANC